MDDQNGVTQILKAFGGAAATLAPLLTNVQFLGLLRGALKCGILEVTRIPSTPTQISEALHMPEDLVTNFCHALDAHGVFRCENGTYRLHEYWEVLTDPETHKPLQDMLNYAFVQSKVLEHIGSQGNDYWETKSFDRLSLAKGVTFDPASPRSPVLIKSIYQECVPEIHSLLSAGGHYLELGCGVGGLLVSLLRAYPKLIAVGVELAADLLEEARQHTEVFDLSDRVTLHCGDASTFETRKAFDFVFWSQFFFPMGSRAGALQVAFHALKPGGSFMAPLLTEPSIIDTDLHSERGKQYTLQRIRYGAWGIPAVGTQDLQREMEEAGFVSPRLVDLKTARAMLAQRP